MAAAATQRRAMKAAILRDWSVIVMSLEEDWSGPVSAGS